MWNFEKIIRWTDHLCNWAMMILFLPIICYGVYVLWDGHHIYDEAKEETLEAYRPTKENAFSIDELTTKNPEVFGWIRVANTHINYPLVQGENNSKYVNTDVFGEFSLAGSIFLDCRNKKDFTDCQSIIYGHHIDKDAMFGELDNYIEKEYFDRHLKGSIYYDGDWHDVQFFAFLKGDAYNRMLYNPMMEDEEVEGYIHYVKEMAMYFIAPSLNEGRRFVTLSTCTSTTTNGRYLLIGQFVEE